MKRTQNISWAAATLWNPYIPLCLCLGASLILALAGCGPNASSPDVAPEAAQRELREIAEAAGSVLNVYMDARVTEMLVASQLDGPLNEVLTAPQAQSAANRALERWRKVSGGYEAILLLDKNGVAVAAAPASLLNRDFSNESVFKGAIQGKVTISEFHKSDVLVSLVPKQKGELKPATGWTLAIGVPISGENNGRGILLGFLNWSEIAHLTASLRIGRTGYVAVVNKQNQVILHPASHIYGTALRDPKINRADLDEAIHKKMYNCRYEYMHPLTHKTDIKLVGLAYPKGFGNFPGQGWTVVASADEFDIVDLHPLWQVLFR